MVISTACLFLTSYLTKLDLVDTCNCILYNIYLTRTISTTKHPFLSVVSIKVASYLVEKNVSQKNKFAEEYLRVVEALNVS